MAGIDSIVYITVAVKDQDEALNWFTEKLGFEKRADLAGPGMRWLTVSPRNQAGLQIVLASWYPDLVGKGTPIGLQTDDCPATYEALQSKGVVFSQAPQNRPFGIEAVFKDLYGNTWAVRQLTQGR